ncbi:hypothetical protein [uncultured Nitratireductor sp.]|uniref:hypothetical protein n=1 Tax=uncultured Nitratireductor sp. TaxID=520953 RepID=UPI0025F37C3E|nr:hypothetical protein [uncultured Nitratireductor sp.]
MIEFQPTQQQAAVIPFNENSLTGLVKRAATQLASASSAAEVLEAKDAASIAYDASKKAARLAKAKGAHDELIAKAHRAQADALEIEAAAKRRLADEYDAAQERGEAAKGRPKTLPEGKTFTAADVGMSHKEIHEARQIRDAEKADPGITRRTLDSRLEAKQEPTKAALREAVVEAAKQGIRGETAPNRKNPHYKAPSKAGAAWTHVYGTCRAFAEWATDENLLLALHGLHERADDQAANIAAVQKAAATLNKFLGDINAH